MSHLLEKGIIFDMDNTLLKSNINFAEMKRAIYQLLLEHGCCGPELDLQNHTASQLIEIGRQSSLMTQELEEEMWAAVTAVEKDGMHGAVLEEQAREVLDELRDRYQLYILTNNAYAAAQEALEETGISDYFTEIVAREQMTQLKPSPSGVHYILRQQPQWPLGAWAMIGDSWIDGKAAQDAGIRFLSYQGKPGEMEQRGVNPVATVKSLRELLNHF
ncbi:HAD-IA family hydrolase [Brevibacillus nitrificans]|uniref:HAD family hydrolase n=1 Tax=Brevibacillus nitrificans TaxID=651560 RepID=UPI002862A70F|nr:HAD-IA family hydrolase [Brevibacillus nitrificans]MDR7319018.1 phosphoglycolate phosphatase [Brevibacillus nitrificans]